MASGLPFYYYHIPDRTGIKLSMEEFLLKARDVIPNLRGIKFSSKDLFEGSKCLRIKDSRGNNFDLLYGCDEQVIAAFAMGFQGAIGSTYSLMPGVYRRARRALEEGHVAEARELQYRSVRLVDICFKFGQGMGGPLPAFKAILSELGIPMGSTRFPMASMDQQMRAKLKDELVQIGFFQWAQE
ncbi:N-acetylneuraminate lyase [Plakobranchus ocellatus]|uniref:N-acetylneuraminate lyase n=1 Tax=Plakobranchus ocellatus TaxID=259542 RepID=A0AAV3ZDE7_9GAST|nr:N-acetylneuraminate lyase [Plakobranchus ocellatus]